MKPVDQTILVPPHANCMQACIASVLEMSLDDVPNFVTYPDHWSALDEFLVRYDLYHLACPPETDWKPTGYHIMDGKSPRGQYHWVVGHNGEMVHDPYPNGEGLVELLYWVMLVRRLERT